VAGESSTIRIGAADKQNAAFIADVRGATAINTNAVPVVIDSAGQLGTMSSSERFKREIKPMAAASKSILELEPVTFQYKRTFQYKSDKESIPQFGLIAEEVAKVDPDLVVRNANLKSTPFATRR
jgi:Chaperone of endosialidase